MRIILKVAATELRLLFFSPIAWFLSIVFLVQCGSLYGGLLEAFARQQEMGGASLKYINNLTGQFFLAPNAMFVYVMQNLYLYIPLLTMSLISRETNSGTIKLLYSSPVKVRYIILGKFLSMMVYSMLLVAIVALFVFSGMVHIQHAEKGMLLSALFGFYMLLLAYSAIGLFMSTLSSYQIVAAVSTFVVIGLLSYVGRLWQDIELVRDLTYFLSISGRAYKMLAGLLTTKDVIYFLLVIIMFVGFSIFKVKAGTESKPWFLKAARYVALIALVLTVGYFSSLPGLVGYWDVTLNKSRTLTPNAQKILAELGDEPLEVVSYNNFLGRFWYLGNPESYNDNLARWESYMRFKPNIKLSNVYYYDSTLDMPALLDGYKGKNIHEIAEHFAKTRDLDLKEFYKPEEIRRIIDLRPELNRFVMQLKWKDRTTFLRVFDDQMVWPSETEVSVAFKRLLQAKLPRIGFLTGNLERSINRIGEKDFKTLTSLKTFRHALVNQGFDVDTISLDDQEIPANISSLVIADPRLELTAASLNRLKKYIDDGGNLLIACEPEKQKQLNPLLHHLGVELIKGQLIQQSEDFSPDLITPNLTPFNLSLSHSLATDLEDSIVVSMPGAAGLTYAATGGFNMQPLLITNASLCWNRKNKLDLALVNSADASFNTEPAFSGTEVEVNARKRNAGTVTFSPADGDERGSFTTALALLRNLKGREQRIIVTGDADFMSNGELSRFNMRTANFTFNTALFKWLSNGEFPVDTSRPPGRDKRVNVTISEAKLLRTAYVWVLPGLLLIAATILLIRRKRK